MPLSVLILVEIFSDTESRWQMDCYAKSGQCVIHCCSSLESVAVYCIWCWAGLQQQDHNNMLIVHHAGDIISRITLRWDWLRPLWRIQSEMVVFTQPLAGSVLFLKFFGLSCSRVLFQLSSSFLPAHEAGCSTGQSFASHSCLSKRNGQTHTHTQTAISLPSAAVIERGRCCQVSCEFETAAERTHCALTKQSSTTAPRLPGTMGSIWHTDEFTHTDERLQAKITDMISMLCETENPFLITILTHKVVEKN